ncbi:MAG: response regulator [Rhodospirillales bacterium]|nr:response regulator [Rhodospirillales bacterium]
MARILVADDAELSRGSISAVLECFGYDVVEAKNGDQCLEALHDKAFDLLITDIDMPQVNGIEVILALKKETPDFPVIAISGYDKLYSLEPLNLAISAGANAILNKPFKAEELLNNVKSLLAKVT